MQTPTKDQLYEATNGNTYQVIAFHEPRGKRDWAVTVIRKRDGMGQYMVQDDFEKMGLKLVESHHRGSHVSVV